MNYLYTIIEEDTFKYDQYNNPIEETRIKVYFEGETDISKNNYLYESINTVIGYNK